MTVLSIEYPYWMMIVGIVLLMLGRVGLALRQRSDEPLTTAVDEEPSEREADPNDVEAYNRLAKERRKERWAGNSSNEEPNEIRGAK